jgi:serine/threonine-protein kinase
MGKIAAMKVLHRDLAHDSETVHRFEREAAAISRLHHPHTVQVFDFGTANDALYLIMEFVRGQDLAHIIHRDGPLPWARAAPLLVQICGALQEAHELGIVHRDLKPENVLITRTTGGRDYAKVLDFGLAKLDQRGAPSAETDRQQIVGTPYFMAPEQIRGDDVDARTDIYSFGALMFNLLTGTQLYTASTAVGVLTKHLTADPDAPSMRAPKMGIPPQVDQLCARALARDPAARWQTAAQLAEAIEDVYTETVGDATGSGPKLSRALGVAAIVSPADHDSDGRLRRGDIDTFERGIRRRRVIVWGTVVVALLAGAGAAAYALLREPPPMHEEHEPNDELAEANPIAAGVPVTGYLGKRRSVSEADRDVYRVEWPGGTRHLVTVRVTGLPNLDERLELMTGDGTVIADVDDGRGGDGEVLHRRWIEGALVVAIGEVVPAGVLPVENVSDPYTLTVTEESPQNGEAEPNDTEADATELALGHAMTGFLDRRADVDLLRWTGSDGTFTVIVRSDGIPLEWRGPDGKARTPGEAKLALKHGDSIRIERTDRTGTAALAGRDEPWTITVAP